MNSFETFLCIKHKKQNFMLNINKCIALELFLNSIHRWNTFIRLVDSDDFSDSDNIDMLLFCPRSVDKSYSLDEF